MAEAYRPTRDYHERNDPTTWPDHSRTLDVSEVIRAFWLHGEQMWDQDANNNFRWVQNYLNDTVFWRISPRYPYYSPRLQKYIADPAKDQWQTGDLINAMVRKAAATLPVYLDPWRGVTCYSRADRIISGYVGNGFSEYWKGWSIREEYIDAIEIAFFMSDVRRNSVAACHLVIEPFKLKSGNYSSRMRNWNYRWAQLQIRKNGVKVGIIQKMLYGSRLRMDATTQFDPGDRLEIFSGNTALYPYSAKAVSVSLYGELL